MHFPVNGGAAVWLRAAKDIGAPLVLAIIVITQLAPPIHEGVEIAKQVLTLMTVEATTGVVCRSYAP